MPSTPAKSSIPVPPSDDQLRKAWSGLTRDRRDNPALGAKSCSDLLGISETEARRRLARIGAAKFA